VEFDLAKIELLYFLKCKGAETAITLPSGDIVKPITKAFNTYLLFKEYIAIRAAKTEVAFYYMLRLANIENGLIARSLRQLYITYITIIADYRSLI
ncbi:hypothetical protein CERZMDRAFT_54289, partial [Cercospora zeae-maydis SCOH1-5]